MGTFIIPPKQTMVPSFPSGKYYTKAEADAKFATIVGEGTVTNVATDATLTGGPITTTGTLGLNLSNANIWTGTQLFTVGNLMLGGAGTGTTTLLYANSVTTGGQFTFPATSSNITVAGINLTQTFTAQQTFSATTSTFGSATTTSIYGYGNGSTISGATKTLNIGTGGVSGSTTNINIGSANGTTTSISGNVGIGTAAPASLLHILNNDSGTGGSDGLTVEQSGTGDSLLQFLLTGAQRWLVGVDNSDSDKFKIQSGTPLGTGAAFTIDTSNNVGIGTTSPNAKLESLATSEQLRLSYDATHYTSFTTGSTGNLSITPSGGTANVIGGFGVTGTVFANIYSNSTSSNNATINASTTGTIITRNVADTNAALTVNQANASSTGAIQNWQFNSGTVATINSSGRLSLAAVSNLNSANNSLVLMNASGTQVTRNVADANPALIVTQTNASSTGDILDLNNSAGTVFSVSQSGNATLNNGNLTLGTAGNKIKITTGTNASIGTATLSGGTVTVNTTAVTANSNIFLTDATTGSLTNVGNLTVGTIVAGTSFVINSTNVLDSSNVNWLIIN